MIKGLILFTLVSFNIHASQDNNDYNLMTEESKINYVLGVYFGNSFSSIMKQADLKVEKDLFLKGINESSDEKNQILNKNEQDDILKSLQNIIVKKQKDDFMKKEALNKEKGAKFLEENKLKDGVITTKTGLQYKVLKQGSGKYATMDDFVEVEYKGTLIDGTEFDSSASAQEPITFIVSGVIPGWSEVLQLMNAGSEYEVYVPSDLAYGESGFSGPIGPNETLIFNIELISISSEDPNQEKQE